MRIPSHTYQKLLLSSGEPLVFRRDLLAFLPSTQIQVIMEVVPRMKLISGTDRQKGSQPKLKTQVWVELQLAPVRWPSNLEKPRMHFKSRLVQI